MSKVKIPKSQAIELLVALGYKSAKRMNCEKLTETINEITEVPGEPMETEELDALIEQLMDGDEAKVVDEEDIDDEDEVEEEETEDTEEEENEEDEDSDLEDEEEDVKPKKGKKGKKEKKAKEEKKPKKNKITEKKQEKKTRVVGKSMDSLTMELLARKPMKIETLVQGVMKEYPDADEEVLTRTTKRRVTGHLQKKYNVVITKSKNGAYSIEE